MPFFAIRRSAQALFSFAGAGIARWHRSSRHGARQARRCTNAGVVHLSSEQLEGRAVLAGASLAGFTPDLITADDSGFSSSDNITNMTTPTFVFTPTGVTFAGGGETIQLRVNGSVVATSPVAGGPYGGGPISLTSTSLTDATYTITLTSDDGTGAGTSSGSLSVKIDTTPPTVSSITPPPAQTFYPSFPSTSQTILFAVGFNEPVYTVGSPVLPITIGSGAASLSAPDVVRDAAATPASPATSHSFSYVVGSLTGNPGFAESTDANGVQVGTTLTTTTAIDDVLDIAGNSVSTAIPAGVTSVANSAMAFAVMVNAAPTAQAQWVDPTNPSGPALPTPAAMLDPRVTPIPNITIKFTDKVTGLPQAVPFSTTAPATPPFGTGTLTLSDFVLTRNGLVIAGSTTVPWPASVRLTCPVSGADAFATYQLSGLEDLTNPTGSYTLTFSDLGLAESRTVSWVKDYSTPVELRATFTPNPGLTLGGTPPRTVVPLDSVTVTFVDAAGAGGGTPTPVPVTGVTVNQAPDVDEFVLYRDGTLLTAFNSLTGPVKINGSGSTYTITGLNTLTDTIGSYELRLLHLNNSIKSVLDADVNPNGSTLKTDESIKWQYSRTTVGSVTEISVPANGSAYKVGEIIEYAVSFVDPSLNLQKVNVAQNTSPSLQFTIGSGTAVSATYNRGSGTSTLIFSYTVKPGDLDTDGVVFNPAIVGSSNITDTLGIQIFNTFTPPSFIYEIDGVAPIVTSVTPPAPGVYTTGTLDFAVNFDDVVNVVGNPTLPITIGGIARLATYNSGLSSGNTLVFSYTITSGDAATGASGSVQVGGAGNSIRLNGGTIRDVNLNDATLAVPTTPVSGVIVNRLAATVTASAGTYKLGQAIDLTATFTSVVNVTGTPTITGTVNTTTGSRTMTFTYISGTGTTALKFRATVAANDLDTDGIAIAGAFIGTINDLAGNAVGVSFTAPTGILVDGVAPTVSTATGPAPGNYNATAGSRDLDITLVFNEPVTVVTTGGTPSIPLTIGSAVRQATYTSGTGTNTIVFRYTITSVTDVFANGSFTVGSTVVLNGGTMKDAAGNDYALAVSAVAISGVNINRTAPTVTITSGLGGGGAPKTSKVGDVIELTATFAQAVNVTGTPTIGILVGGTARNASYTSGTGTTAIKFQYVVQAGDLDTDGIAIPGSVIVLGGTPAATLTDSVGTPVLSFAAPATTGVQVDGVAPAVSSVTPPAPGLYTTGSLSFAVNFDDVVNVVGNPTLPITIGGIARLATYVGGTGTSTLVFSYTITSGDAATGASGSVQVGGAGNSIRLNGGTIKDVNGNDATLTVPTTQVSGVIVNRLAATVTATAGTYKLGQAIDLTATFTSAVNVTGTPTITGTVNTTTGSRTVTFTYISGTGTTALKFRATVAANDLDTDGVDIAGGFVLGTGTPAAAIADLSGNAVGVSFTQPTAVILVDGVAPTVTAVTQPLPGVYGTGSTLDFTANFDDVVTVTGSPTLPITIGGIARQAMYNAAASSGSRVVFRYTVVAGDSASGAAGSVQVGSLITLNGGTIRDVNLNDATLTVPATTVSSVVVNRLTATVTASANKTYRLGETIQLTATFTELVNVTGIPTILGTVNTTTGSRTLTFNYVSGTGTTALVFRATVAAGDLDTDGIELGGLITLAGTPVATIANAAGSPVGLAFTAPVTTGILVDGVAPTVTAVTQPLPGVYGTGSTLDFTANFDDVVTVTGSPTLPITIGGIARQAVYNAAASTGSRVVFRYTVVAGDSASGAAGSVQAGSLITLNGGTIRDANLNDATLAVPATTISSVVVNRLTATVTASANKTYRLGETIQLTATFTELVNVTGIPTILGTVNTTTGSRTLTFNYVGGTGTTALVFRATVAAGDLDTDGIELGGLITLAGTPVATIANAAGSPVGLAFTAPVTTGILVDGVAPQASAVITGPIAGTYITSAPGAGGTLTFIVPLDDVVTVTGTPVLTFTTLGSLGPNVRQAAYVGGTGTSQLRFEYAVQTGDFADRVTIAANPISLNGGTIRDAAGNDANFASIAPATFNGIFINLTTVNSVTLVSPNDRYYRAGETILFDVAFTAPVTVTGTPTLPLIVGTTSRNANYVSGSGTKTLRFAYTVAAGHDDPDGLQFGATSIALPGGATITNSGGNVLLAFVPPDITGVRVDAVSPTITPPVVVPNSGNYRLGDVLQFEVRFDESLRVTPQTGTGNVPRIAMVIGSTTRYADYVAGSETPVLVFDYTVQAGDLDSNGIVVSTAILLNGATITDLAGNSGGLTFAPPPTNGVLVDGVAPTVTRFSTSKANGRYTVGESIAIVATMSETVRAGSAMEVMLNTGAILTLTAAANGTTLTGTYVVASGENTPDLDVDSYTDIGVLDLFGNVLGITALPSGANSIGGARNIVIDTLAPTVLSFTSTTPDGFYRVGTPVGGIAITATISETVRAGSSFAVTLDSGAVVTLSTTAQGTTLTGTYVISAGQNSPDLTVTSFVSGTLRDLAGNALDTSLPPAGANIAATKAIVVDTTVPLAAAVPMEQGSGKLADGFINLAESATSTTLRVGLGTSGAVENDRVDLLLGGVAFTPAKFVTLSAANITDGFVEFTVTAADLGADGSKQVTARVTDRAGNVGAISPALSFVKDTAAPTAPSIALAAGVTPPVSRAEATLAAGIVSLTAEAGATVTLTFTRGAATVTKTVTGTGTNQGVVLTNDDVNALGDGLVAVSASQIDAAGNPQTAAPASLTFTLDATAPTAPTVNPLTTNVRKPMLTGSATLLSGETLSVTVNGITFSSATAGNFAFSGTTWALNTATATGSGAFNNLTDGTYAVTATITDAAGNATSDSTTNELVVDTIAPTAPTVNALTTNVRKPVLTGTATLLAGETLSVAVNGITFSSATAGNFAFSGTTWSLNTATATGSGAFNNLTDGTYAVTATITDAAGNATSDSTTNELVVDTVAPTAPTVNALMTNVRKPVLTGTATLLSGETLSITVNGITFNNVAVTGGTWSLNTATATGSGAFNNLADGTYAVTATVTDAVGNATSDTTTNELVIDTVAPTAPTVNTLTTNVRKPTLTGSATPLAGEALSVTVNGITFSSATAGNFSFSGTTWALNTATATGSGGFNNLADGTYAVTATVTDAAGNAASDTTTNELVIDTVAPTAPTVNTLTTNVRKPTLTGSATLLAGEALSVTVNGITFSSATAGNFAFSGTTWALNTATATDSGGFNNLADGTYAVTATVTDAAGNAASDTTTNELVIDTVAPTEPTVNPLMTNVRKPVLTGSATLLAGEALSVTVNGITFNNVAVTGGTWSLNTATATGSGAFNNLADGTYAVTATVTDAAGNATSDSTTNELVIDAVAPTAPTVNTLTTNVRKPTLTGSATLLAGETLSVAVNGITFSSATAGNFAFSGTTWSLNTATATGSGAFNNLADGTYAVTATVTDAGGNATSDSTTNELVIDTVAPTVSSVTSSTPDGAYKPASTISIQIQMSEPVSVVGSPTLALNVGRNATFVNVTGGNVLNFTYTVVAGDNTADVDYASTTALALNGGTIRDAAGNNATLTLPAPGTPGSLGANKAIVIDTTAPTVVSVAAAPTGNVGGGQMVTLTATMSEPVQAGSSLVVTLDTGNDATLVAAASGKTLTGSFTVEAGQLSNNLRVTAVGLTLDGTRDLVGNELVAANVDLPTGVSIDGTVKLLPVPGFSDGTGTTIQNLGNVTAIPIRFSVPVTGVTLSAFSLMLNGRTPLSLRGASLVGSGTSYTLFLPRQTTRTRGVYTLTVAPNRGISAQQNGAPMTSPSYMVWGNGTTSVALSAVPAQRQQAGVAPATTAPRPTAVVVTTLPTAPAPTPTTSRPTRPTRR